MNESGPVFELSMLLTSDDHLRAIGFQRLTFELARFDRPVGTRIV
jgi:hypothetical protein